MARKRYRAEEIIHKLREAEVAFAQGKLTVGGVRSLALPRQAYYR